MSQVKYKFIEPLPPPLTALPVVIAPGDKLPDALAKLQAQILAQAAEPIFGREFHTFTFTSTAAFYNVPINEMVFSTTNTIDVFLNGDLQDNVTVPSTNRIVPSEPFVAGDVIRVVHFVNTGPLVQESASKTSQVEVDVGVQFVDEASFEITELFSFPNSIVTASIAGKTPSDGRDLDEIYIEQVSVFARPQTGTIRFDLLPREGMFSGTYVINYTVSNP